MNDTRIALIEAIDALLPQTQCQKCQHPGCRPYAEAIAAGEAINHCVPGGEEVITALAALTGRPHLSLDPSYGQTLSTRLVAYIREEECIGCTKCIQACPVDAIVGASGMMHTVLAADCTGCDLCVAPCPVDCIEMRDSGLPRLPDPQESVRWRTRHHALLARRAASAPPPPRPTPTPLATLKVAAALARSELKKHLKDAAAAPQHAQHESWRQEQQILEQRVADCQQKLAEAELDDE